MSTDASEDTVLPAPTALVERAYDLVSGDRGERVCTDLSEDACRAVPRNFFLQLGARTATKIGDSLSSPSLVLPWLLSALAAPAYLIAALVPVREAGSLLPQLAFGSLVRRHAVRRWFWVGGSALQGAAVLAMALAAATLEGVAAGLAVVGALVLFSLARGVCSVSTKDLVGKTIPRTRRGRLGGIASSLAGVVAVAVGVSFWLVDRSSLTASILGVLLASAGALWLIAAGAVSVLREERGDAGGDDGLLRAALGSVSLLRTDATFRRFLIARALLASTVLGMPFYVILARDATGGQLGGLGLLVVASSLATSLSAVVWGWLADRSSRVTLSVAGLAAGVIGCVTFGVSFVDVPEAHAFWVWTTLFFVLALAHTGIRLGRKTYIVDMAPGDKRPLYVALGNTVIGIVLVVGGLVGALADLIGERWVILIYAVLGVAGGAIGLGLDEVEDSSDAS